MWADRSGETIDWFTDVLAESGIDFRHEIDEKHDNDNYEVLDVGHSTQYDEYNEKLTMDAVLKHAEADGLEVQYEITMVKLEKDGNRVTGLIAKNANDEYVRYNASKGVILACGGYSGNETMMNALQPQSVEQTCVNYSKSGAKGDGIKACLWAGAIMDTTHTSMIFDRGAIKPDQVGEYGKANDGARFWMGSQPFLKVNLNGERFMNEYMPYDLVLHAAASQPYHTYCTVWDSKYPEDVKRFATHGCSRLYPHVNGTAPVFPMEYIEGMNADLQDQGYIVQADTVEELADQAGPAQGHPSPQRWIVTTSWLPRARTRITVGGLPSVHSERSSLLRCAPSPAATSSAPWTASRSTTTCTHWTTTSRPSRACMLSVT